MRIRSLPLGLAASALLAVSCAPPAPRPASGLVFEPALLSVDGQTVGKRPMSVRLVNRSGMRMDRILLRQTCGCIELPRLPKYLTLDAGASLEIPFILNEPTVGEVDQALFAWPEGKEVTAGRLSIRGRLMPPVEIGELPRLSFSRLAPGIPFAPCLVDLPLAPGVRVLKVQSGVPWLDVAAGVEENRLRLRVRPSGDAPDGSTIATMTIVHQATDGKSEGEHQIPLPLSLSSEIHPERSRFWLGRIAPGRGVTRETVIRGPRVAERLRVPALQSGLDVAVVPKGRDKVALRVRWVPTGGGYQTRSIPLVIDGRRVGALSVSALVKPSV